jgi:hypothetical protein
MLKSNDILEEYLSYFNVVKTLHSIFVTSRTLLMEHCSHTLHTILKIRFILTRFRQTVINVGNSTIYIFLKNEVKKVLSLFEQAFPSCTEENISGPKFVDILNCANMENLATTFTCYLI